MKKTIKKIKPAKLDLTDRSRVEQSLRNSELRYRRLFETTQDGILILDAKTGAITDVNPHLIDMLGYSREEFIEKKLWEVGAFKDIEASKDAFEALQKNEYIRYENLPLKAKGGQLIQVEFVSNVYLVGDVKVIQCNIRDITEHKQLLAALQENERKYRTLVTQSPDGIFLVDLSGDFLTVNKAACESLGFSEEEFRSMSIWDIVPEQYLEQHRKRLTKILNGESLSEPAEYTVRGKDGKIHYIEVLSAPYYREKGIIGFQGIARDITERKRAEEALRESESLYRTLFDDMPIGLGIADRAGNLRFFNDAILQPGGYTRDDLSRIGNVPNLYYTQEQRAEVLAVARQQGFVHQHPVQFKRKDGTYYDALLSMVPVQIKGEPGWQAIVEDITERKRAEEALRESEERYRLLVETLPDGVVVHSQGRVVFANPASATIIGAASSADLIGKPVIEFVHPDYRERALKRIQQSLSEGVPASLAEEKFVRLDGTPIDIEVSAIPFSYAGKPAMLTVFNDITERKRVDEMLLESELKFRTLFDRALDGILIADMETHRFFMGNSAICQMLGYTHDELSSIGIDEIHPLEHLPYVVEQFNRQARGEIHLSGDIPVRRKDGSVFYADINSTSVTLSGHTYMMGIFRDITERKQAEQALRESEARYRLIADNITDTIWLADLNMNLVYASPSLERARGYTFDELRAMPPDQHFAPASLELVMRTLGEAFAAENLPNADKTRVRTLELESYRKDGSTFWNETKFTFVRDNEGKPTAILAASRDITERKHVEETLRHRLAELEALHTVSTALRAAQTRDEALPILLDETLSALETDAGAIWLYHPDSDELRVAVARGWFRQFQETLMKPGEGIVGTVFATGQAHITAEFRRDPLVRQPATGEIPAGWGGVCLPIRTGAITVGVLFVAALLPRQITNEQVKLLESLTGMAGTTLHRMSLHEETVRQLDRLEALHSIDIAISASMDLQMTLNILLEHVKTQLNADATSVLLLNPHSQTLEYAAGRGFRTRSVQTTRIRLGENFAGRAALERRVVQADEPAQIQKSPHFAALWAGEDFADYYGVPLIAKGEVKGVLEVYRRAPFHPESDWISFLETLAGQAAIAIDSAQVFENLQRSTVDLALAYDATIEGWSRALDLRDRETEGHTLRVTEITMQLAKAMGIGDAELAHIRRGGLLHDIGKMGVPDSILFKPGSLTDDEWRVMRLHPQLAYDMLSPISYLRQALDIPYCHHEKWDGSGYPRGLKGEQIPFSARLFAVVDVWDALRSDRPYRPAWPEDKVLEHIRSLAGTHFDPQVVKVCLELGVLGTQAPE